MLSSVLVSGFVASPPPFDLGSWISTSGVWLIWCQIWAICFLLLISLEYIDIYDTNAFLFCEPQDLSARRKFDHKHGTSSNFQPTSLCLDVFGHGLFFLLVTALV